MRGKDGVRARETGGMGGADLKVNENECHEFLELY